MTVVRIGVVGAGPPGQAHLCRIAQLRDRYRLVGIADPREPLRTELARRFEIPATYADHDQLIEAGELDALLVATPPAARASIAIDALEAGLHLLVEKPLCITLADADRIVALRDATERVVQVGYGLRFDLAYEEMHRNLPDHAEDLRYIEVSAWEPGLAVAPQSAEPAGEDGLSKGLAQAAWRAQAEQVSAAVGTRTRRETVMFSQVYLGGLAESVNLVHALLGRMNERLPCSVEHSAWWEGPSMVASLRLSTGARWGLRWIETSSSRDVGQRIALFFEDSVHALALPPLDGVDHAPAVYECRTGDAERQEARLVSSHRSRVLGELLHFHDCVTEGALCRTPPEQAREDIALLTSLFLAARDSGCGESRLASFAVATAT